MRITIHDKHISHYRDDVREAYVDWIAGYDWEFAGTFTFKANVDEVWARKTFYRFWNSLDHETFKNSVRRYNKRYERACFIETGHDNDNWHYHVAAKLPDRFSADRYGQLISTRWADLGCAGILELKPIFGIEGWIDYISKNITAFNTDAFDVQASHFARY